MDAETLKLITDTLQHGGNLALVLIVWSAYRAAQTAKDAVASLKKIEQAVTERAAADLVRDQKLDTLHADLQTLMTLTRNTYLAPKGG